MVMKEKVTREIADYIRRMHEDGFTYREISEKIESEMGVVIPPGTVGSYGKPFDE